MAYSQLFTLEKRVNAIEYRIAILDKQLSTYSKMPEEQKKRIRAAIRDILTENGSPIPLNNERD